MNEKIKLWENGTPLYNAEYGQEEPYIMTYLLENDKKNNPCVIVIPGGGYGFVCYEHEGDKICRFLNSQGYSAFYLMYRVEPYHFPCMELVAKRAIRLVRYNAEKFHIDPQRIGITGFSAGGHLTCMAGLRYDYGMDNGDEIDKVSSRPDTAAPCYAVASLDKNITHMGTRNNFLGEDNTDERAFAFSSENIIPDDAPPFFLFHTAEDTCVPVECSIRLAKAFSDKKMPFSLHIFPYGDHGIGIGEDTPLANEWPMLYVKWMNEVYSRASEK